jgi:hypothetical protein
MPHFLQIVPLIFLKSMICGLLIEGSYDGAVWIIKKIKAKKSAIPEEAQLSTEENQLIAEGNLLIEEETIANCENNTESTDEANNETSEATEISDNDEMKTNNLSGIL